MLTGAYASDEAYRVRFTLIAGTTFTLGAIGLAIWTIVTGAPLLVVAEFAISAPVFALAVGLAARGLGSIAVAMLIYGGFFAATTGMAIGGRDPEVLRYTLCAVEFIYVCGVLSPFLTAPRTNLIFGPVSILVMIAVEVHSTIETDSPLVTHVTEVAYYGILWGAATRFARFLRAHQTTLTDRFKDIDIVVSRAQRIAKGDLSGELTVDQTNAVSRVIADMLLGLRSIVVEMQESVRVLATTSTHISTMATEQQRGAVHQSSAVAETRETIQSLVASSHKITEAADGVLRNARSAQQTNERANEQLNALANHTRRINELLEFVKDVSNKSEILALNAALEGTKAGEAGRGFSLVAAQMRRLAESTASAITDVKELTSDITRSTSATVVSMEEATKLARDTTVAAQQISLITQQQSSGAQQVLEAMGDIATVTREFADGTKDALTAIAELKALSERFATVAHRFVL